MLLTLLMMRIALVLFLALLAFGCRSGSNTSSSSSEPRSLPTGTTSVSGPVLSYAPTAEHVAPAVVTIRSTQRVRAPQQFPFFNDPFFRQFFGGRAPQGGGGGGSEIEESLGSGVIVRSDGYILTNYHVISGANQITVDLSNRQTYTAKVIGYDQPSDLAVLKIDAAGLPVLQLGNSDDVRVGDICLAVGNPLGIGETVTSGIISAKQRATGLSTGNFEDFLQTDAAINKGNSGGALVNTRGELIGINSQILTPTGGFIGIGFAIPSNMAKRVMDQLMKSGKVQRGMLGVTVEQMTSGLAESFGLKQMRGVLISNVSPDSPAAKAGLKRGDVILKLNGKDVNDSNVFRNEIASQTPGAEVTLTIWRNNAQTDVRVRLGEWKPTSPTQQQPSESGGGASNRLGLTVEPLTPDLAAQLELPRGTRGVVITQVDPTGPAALAGIQPGDVIQEVNRRPVRTPDDIRAALEASGNKAPLLLINRGGQTIYVSVPQQ